MVPLHEKSLRPMLKVPATTVNLKRQGGAIIDHVFFHPTKRFLLEKYFQLHIKSHEIYAASLDPVLK